MRVITIGRSPECDVVVNHDMVSHRHALLKLYGNGKIEIVDVGRNGTYINNVQLKPNVPTPVSRKDVVSFAHVRQLDWKQVPDVLRPIKIIGVILSALLVVALLVWGIRSCGNGTPEPVVAPDSAQVETPTAAPISTDVKGDTATRLDAGTSAPAPATTTAAEPEKLDASHFGITTPQPTEKKPVVKKATTPEKKAVTPEKKEEKPSEGSTQPEQPAEKPEPQPTPTQKPDSV